MSLRNQTRDHFQSRWSGKDGIARLEFADFELHLIFFRIAHIRRVGDDEVEGIVSAFRFNSGEQVGLVKVNARFEFMASRIDAGDFKCGRRNVDRVDFRAGKFFG